MQPLFKEIRGFIALYFVNFLALIALYFYLDGFQSYEGLVYFIFLSFVLLAGYLAFYLNRRRKILLQEQEEKLLREQEREKAAAVEEKYHEQMLFINRWVHYVKTPLSVILSIAQEAESYSPEESTSALQQIQIEGDRVLDGVNAALNFARATDFVSDFKIETFDLHLLLVGLINELKRNFIRNQIYPQLEIPAGTMVRSDFKWLKFIFFQILTNAIKYSYPEGKIRIYKEGTSFCVADSGLGISEEDLPRIFDIFYTGSVGRTRGESTGIGLYLVKTLCDKLDYRVRAVSQEGVGTTLLLDIPQPA